LELNGRIVKKCDKYVSEEGSSQERPAEQKEMAYGNAQKNVSPLLLVLPLTELEKFRSYNSKIYNIQLQKLTVDQAQAFYTKLLKNTLSAGTVRVIHAILFAALKDAVKWKRLAVNVCTAVTLPRLAQCERQPLTKEQALQLLEAAQGNRLECLLTLALATGMRLGELLALRWDDIHLEERTLRVAHTARYVSGLGMIESEPKTESSRRSILLPQFAVDMLKQHRTHQLETRLQAGAAW